MRKKYNCMTFFMCLLVAFAGALLIGLFTMVKANHIRDTLFEKVEVEVRALTDEMAPKYTKGSKEWDRFEKMSKNFFEELNEIFKNDTGVTFAGNIGYYNGEERIVLDEKGQTISPRLPSSYTSFVTYYSGKEWYVTDWSGNRVFPTSGDAREIFENYYLLLDNNGIIDNIFLTATNYWEPFLDPDGYCRMIFVVHPLEQAIKRNLQWYILMIVALIVLEWIIVRIRKKRFVGMRYRELMDSTLTTGFSHELKTPLAILRASVENWDYIEDEDKPRYLEKVSEETKHLDNLIHKLTTLGEMKSEGTDTDFETLDLYSLMMESYERLKPLMDERKLEVEIVADRTKEYFVEGNPEMLRIAVNNYISNAVKYAKHRIVLELKEKKRTKKIRFNVTNNGAGLSKEETKKVWTLFFKKDQARTDRLGSSGVGLAVTKNILQLHKAKFGCRSNDRGTTFWFALKADSFKK